MKFKQAVSFLTLGLLAPSVFGAISAPDADGIKVGSEPSLFSLLGMANNTALNAAAIGNFTVPLTTLNQYSSLLIEVAGNANNNVFGIYDLADTSDKVAIFPGPASPLTSASLSISGNDVTVANGGGTLTAPSGFGFYLAGPGGTFYSQTSDNAPVNGNKYDQMAAIDITGTKFINPPYNALNTGFVLAWEDVKVGGGADRDFNDMVMTFTAQPIPEPTTVIAGALLLLPFGVSTIRMLRRKA